MTTSAANTLYVTTDGAYLSKESETLVVSIDHQRRSQVPFLAISSVICFGRVSLSPDLMGALTQYGVHVSFFSYNGRFLARVEGAPGGNVLLRRAQFRTADSPEIKFELARSFILGKLVNTRRFLIHAARDSENEEARRSLDMVSDHFTALLKRIPFMIDLDELRGIEGAAAQSYFGVFSSLIKKQNEAFAFQGRNRRPPRDRVNAMLSFGYTLLHTDCAGAASGVGLDPAVGFLHEERPGRLSLALDLMEELRIPIVDRLIIALINREQIQPNDFREEDGGEWRMTDSGRKTFLVAYQKAKQAAIHHPFLDQETTWALIPHLQARLLARRIRGDLDAYPPFEIRS